jgi:hypothetical protein
MKPPQHLNLRYPMNKAPRCDVRTLLAGALWIAASVALGGCARQTNVNPALPKAPVAVMDDPGEPVLLKSAISRDLFHLDAIPDARGLGDLAPQPGELGEPDRRSDAPARSASRGGARPRG